MVADGQARARPRPAPRRRPRPRGRAPTGEGTSTVPSSTFRSSEQTPLACSRTSTSLGPRRCQVEIDHRQGVPGAGSSAARVMRPAPPPVTPARRSSPASPTSRISSGSPSTPPQLGRGSSSGVGPVRARSRGVVAEVGVTQVRVPIEAEPPPDDGRTRAEEVRQEVRAGLIGHRRLHRFAPRTRRSSASRQPPGRRAHERVHRAARAAVGVADDDPVVAVASSRTSTSATAGAIRSGRLWSSGGSGWTSSSSPAARDLADVQRDRPAGNDGVSHPGNASSSTNASWKSVRPDASTYSTWSTIACAAARSCRTGPRSSRPRRRRCRQTRSAAARARDEADPHGAGGDRYEPKLPASSTWLHVRGPRPAPAPASPSPSRSPPSRTAARGRRAARGTRRSGSSSRQCEHEHPLLADLRQPPRELRGELGRLLLGDVAAGGLDIPATTSCARRRRARTRRSRAARRRRSRRGSAGRRRSSRPRSRPRRRACRSGSGRPRTPGRPARPCRPPLGRAERDLAVRADVDEEPQPPVLRSPVASRPATMSPPT